MSPRADARCILRTSLVGVLTVMIIVPLFPLVLTGMSQIPTATALTEYVLNSSTSCVALPVINGTAVADAQDGAQCIIPPGATLDLTGVSLTIIYPDYLYNRGEIILDDGARIYTYVFIHQTGKMTLSDGSAIYFSETGSVENYGTANQGLFIDETSFIINSGYVSAGATIHNSGTIQNECGAIVSGKSNIVGNPVVEVCPPGTVADATNQATGQSMYASGRTFYGEKFGPGADIIGKVVDCVTVELRKHGSPTGMAEIGFYDISLSDPNKIVRERQFGTIDVNTFTTGYKAYEFCADSPFIVRQNLMVGVKYLDGDPINRIDVRRSNTGAGPDYDGLAAYHVNYDTMWHIYDTDGKSRDLLFKLTKTS